MPSVPFSHRISRLRPTAVNQVLQEVRDLQTRGNSLVSLMRGQPDTPTPAHIDGEAQRVMHVGRTGYAANQEKPVIRQAVADKRQREQKLSYDTDREILITDGATLGVYAALGALVNRNRAVLLPDPIYDAYEGPIA